MYAIKNASPSRSDLTIPLHSGSVSQNSLVCTSYRLVRRLTPPCGASPTGSSRTRHTDGARLILTQQVVPISPQIRTAHTQPQPLHRFTSVPVVCGL